MMMTTITVCLNSAPVMDSGYDDAATRAAAVSQSRYSEFSLLRHNLTISDFILGHIARAEYSSHLMVLQRSVFAEASAHKIRASKVINLDDLQS